MSKTEVFIAYSHRDQKIASEIMKHLQPLEKQGLIFTSSDDSFMPGSNWESQIKQHINQANIILLLISASFLASSHFEDIENEVQRALKRQEAGDVRVIPIIVRPVSWRGTQLDKLQPLPTGGKPITSWTNLDVAFLDIAQGVRKVVTELTKDTPQSPNPLLEAGDMAEKKERLANLEVFLLQSYSIVRDYENVFRLSNDAKVKQQAQKSIKARLARIRGTLSEYMELANEIGIIVPEDIIQNSARFEDVATHKM